MLSSELLMRRGLLATQAATAWSACASCLPSTQSCHYPRRSSRPISASGIAHYKVALQVQPTFWSDAYARSMRLRFMQKLTGLGGRPGSECLRQHLREVAIDHAGGVFEGTNDFVENIGGRSPLTVEAFVTEHRHALEQR